VSIGRGIRRWLQAVAAPSVFLLLVVYFIWNATQGDRGLRAYSHRLDDLKAAQLDLSRAEGELGLWERRVAGMRTNRLDSDALDERSRSMLHLSDPTDVVIPYGPGKRLY
jgi:cell division protein FtsB